MIVAVWRFSDIVIYGCHAFLSLQHRRRLGVKPRGGRRAVCHDTEGPPRDVTARRQTVLAVGIGIVVMSCRRCCWESSSPPRHSRRYSALLAWTSRRERLRGEVVARQIALTDAVHERLGAVIAPVVRRRRRGGWQVRIAVRFERPAVTGTSTLRSSKCVRLAFEGIPRAARRPGAPAPAAPNARRHRADDRRPCACRRCPAHARPHRAADRPPNHLLEMKIDGTPIVRPENSCSSDSNAPPLRDRYQLSPP